MTIVATVIAAFLLIAIGVLAMAIGVIFRRPCLRGSCGGPGVVSPTGERLTCADCPNRHERSA